MDKLNVSVIGCGVWGRNHARVYRQIPFVNLYSVSDISEKSAIEVAGLYGSEYTTDPMDIIRDPNVDMVSVCTPTITHAEIGLKALEAGKHVLVEKPMTNTLDEAKALISMAKEKNLKLTVGFVERFNPAVSKALELIKDGQIGEVLLAHARRVSRRPLRIGDVGVVVFPTGVTIHKETNRMYLYYGAADSKIAVATASMDDIREYIMNCPKV